MKTAVLVLSYNDASTIEAAVRSVTAQHRRHELTAIVLADDASHDDTVERARAAAVPVPFMVLAAQQNQGPWPNLNRALREMSSQFEWALILHADDLATEGWVDALVDRIDACGADVASISTSWDMLYGVEVQRSGERQEGAARLIRGSTEAVHDTLLKGCWWKISGAAVRISAFLDIGDFDAVVHQCADWDWVMRALERGWSFEYIPRVHTIYRQHAATMSTTSLRTDIDIHNALIMIDRYGHTLSKPEVAAFHWRRGRYALRRLARGLLRGDVRRVGTSLHTFAALGRHLARQLAA